MLPSEVSGERVLFGCLDWGSGHVARSIGIIRQLQEQGNTIFLWCSEKQQRVFDFYLEDVEYIIGFKRDFHFKGDGNFRSELLRNIFRQFFVFRKERKLLKEVITEKKISLIISDHRYGLVSKKIPSVFIAHQVKLPRKSGRIAQLIHTRLIHPFTRIWIPDDISIRLAGKLGDPVENSSFIGLYSRFKPADGNPNGNITAIISGPEPYNRQFYKAVLRIAAISEKKWTIIAPKEMWEQNSKFQHISDWKEADEAIAGASLIVSRPGYSTLMDLMILGREAILVPTPGQYEQEYLSDIHRENNYGWRFAGNVEELEEMISESL